MKNLRHYLRLQAMLVAILGAVLLLLGTGGAPAFAGPSVPGTHLLLERAAQGRSNKLTHQAYFHRLLLEVNSA